MAHVRIHSSPKPGRRLYKGEKDAPEPEGKEGHGNLADALHDAEAKVDLRLLTDAA